MQLRISLVLCAFAASILLGLSGCASLDTEPKRITAESIAAPLSLQRPDERPLISRSGRFVVQATRTARQPTDHGAQGQFEWLEFRSGANKARQLLLFLNPLGQSGPSLERELLLDRASIFSSELKWQADAVRIFDEQGNPLAQAEQRVLLSKLIGPQVSEHISDAQTSALLSSVMNLFQATVIEQERHHHRIYSSDALELSVRIAYDDAPPASDMTGAAPQ